MMGGDPVKRRQFLHQFVATAGVFSLAPTLLAMQTAQARQTPNLLVLFADDMTYTDLGCYGNADVQTPHLDRLATESLRFNYCFNSAPMCAPTRMSLYTGIHPVRNGAYPNHSRIYDHIRTWPDYLSDLGYHVGLIGKTHHAPAEKFPFDFLGGRHHDGGKGIDLDLGKVGSFIAKHKKTPWCLIVSSNQPHVPWNRGATSQYTPELFTLPPYLVDTPETREALAKYYGEISYMDNQMGQVLEYLRMTGQEEETLVIFLSEQGSNFPHCKWTCYETGLRSACLVRWPGKTEPGSATDAMIQYTDILPTFIDIAGGDPDQHDFDGSSFLDVLTGKASSHHTHVYGVQTSKGIYYGPSAYGIRTVRDTRYRLIWNLNHENEFSNLVTEGFEPYLSWKEAAEQGNEFAAEQYNRYKSRPEFELYDLKKDPFEMINLADRPEQQEKKESLFRKLQSWMDEQGDQGVETERKALERQVDR